MTRDRAAERAFVRAHHPDVGGDPEVFVAGLAALRAGGTTGAVPVTVVATRRAAPARLLRRLRRARRAAQRSRRLR